MKNLVVCVLGCAVIVVARAAGATPEEDQTGQLAKRTFHYSYGWSPINGHLFRFISTRKTWAAAERYCQAIGGNLASIHNFKEHHGIQRMIRATGYRPRQVWIGGSDAQQKGYWFWIDGTSFHYTSWCRGQPNNYRGRQHCLQMYFGSKKCWNDYQCNYSFPFVCAKHPL